MPKPDEQTLRRLYEKERTSPERIGAMYGVSGRSVRLWLASYRIPRLGPAHLRKGVPASWNKGRTHSREHREKNAAAKRGIDPVNKGTGSVQRLCVKCGTPFSDKPYRRSRYCAAACRDAMRGESHWNFKGGEAGFRQRQRAWVAYIEWRKAVMQRDLFTCQKCGASRGRLTAHHINSWSAFPSERFHVHNGATLCWKCHWHFHREYGHKTSTRGQYEAWLLPR